MIGLGPAASVQLPPGLMTSLPPRMDEPWRGDPGRSPRSGRQSGDLGDLGRTKSPRRSIFSSEPRSPRMPRMASRLGEVENAIDDQLNLPYVDIFLRHSPKIEIKEKDIITFSHNSHRKAISLVRFLKALQHQKIFYTSAAGDFQDKLQACTKATQNTKISPTSSTFHPIPKPVDNVHTTQGGKSRK